MRLIDADVLKQHIDKLPALPDGNFAGNHSALKALINMQPTFEPSTNCSELPNSSDAISRQAAIDALGERPMVWVGSDYELGARNQYDADVLALETVPPAQPERKRGRWNITDAYPHNVYCSECYTRFAQTHWAVWEDGSLPRNFCPNCGADMREVSK